MYLTDYREYCLKDVISQLEPELFRKVTGLSLKDFELLVSLGVFNSELMNDAVYKFKRYEDSSLNYTGIDTRKGTVMGLWDTSVDTTVMIQAKQEATPDSITPTSTAVLVSDPPTTIANTSIKEPLLEKPIQVGDTLIHKSLGRGTVMAMDEKYIIIQFSDRESKFLYPSAFEKGYLKRDDSR